MRSALRRMSWVLPVLAGCVLFAPAANASGDCDQCGWLSGWTLPENISVYGRQVDNVYKLILYITTFFFVLTEALLLWTLFRYRYKEGRKSDHVHGNHKLELIWTVIPALILVFIVVFQTRTWSDIKMNSDKINSADALKVQVFAKQFEWNFRYPGNDNQFGTDDDVYTNGNLYVPVNRTVVLEMRSLDVIHSLFMPHLRFKQDLMPGMTIYQWFQAVKTTAAAQRERNNPLFNYEIACAELCGIGHTAMAGRVTILEQAEFADWQSKASAAAGDTAVPDVWQHWQAVGDNTPEVAATPHPETK